MAQRASIKDVAEAAGVSFKTVSRGVNGVPSVAPEVRARVEAAIAELHYLPNSTARSLKTGAAHTVAVVVDSIDDVFFAAVASAIEDRAVTRGLGVVIGSTRHDPDREREQLLRLTGQHVLGVVLAPSSPRLDYFQPYRSSVPLVTIDRPVAGYDAVTVDDQAAADEVVELLLQAGHRRVAMIGWDPAFTTAERRRAGYEDALHRHGIEPDAALVPPVPLEAVAGVEALHALLSLPEPPSALFLSNARHAPAVISRLHADRRCDLALVSFGDFLLADAVDPSVTCVDHDPYEIGSAAFDRLLELTQDPADEPRDRQMPTRLIRRQSHLLTPVVAGKEDAT